MSRILVAYFSQTGNTEKVARAIYEALKGEKSIQPLHKVDEKGLESFGLIFVGFPVHSHSVPLKVEALLRKIPKAKRVALFSTHGSLSGSPLSRQALQHAIVLVPQAKVLGTFSCRGKVSLPTLEVLNKSPEHLAWAEMAASARTHPDVHDLEDAKSFARWIQTVDAQT